MIAPCRPTFVAAECRCQYLSPISFLPSDAAGLCAESLSQLKRAAGTNVVPNYLTRLSESSWRRRAVVGIATSRRPRSLPPARYPHETLMRLITRVSENAGKVRYRQATGRSEVNRCGRWQRHGGMRKVAASVTVRYRQKVPRKEGWRHELLLSIVVPERPPPPLPNALAGVPMVGESRR